MQNALIICATVLAGGLMLWPRLAQARLWRASITPLASIIGSGFLVLGPILVAQYGVLAPFVMGGLSLLAYALGGAIRFNIAALAREEADHGPTDQAMEALSAWALTFAYIISVAYYLNLFGAFAVNLTKVNDAYHARLVTSAVFVLILFVGWTRGFGALEQLEQISVGVKLAIIAGLLVGLGALFVERADQSALIVSPAQIGGWPAMALAFGLLVTVQGFETSRYLSAEYDAETRIRSMRLAQWTATAIYVAYIGLLTFLFAPDSFPLTETAIIDMMHVVAPILPVLLIAAALAAQFSAAVADTGGSGGLFAELTAGRVSARGGYAILVIAGLALTWAFSVFEIISYASRAFAAYYALQAAIAARRAFFGRAGIARTVFFAGLAGLAAIIAVFGTPVE